MASTQDHEVSEMITKLISSGFGVTAGAEDSLTVCRSQSGECYVVHWRLPLSTGPAIPQLEFYDPKEATATFLAVQKAMKLE